MYYRITQFAVAFNPVLASNYLYSEQNSNLIFAGV